MIAVELSGDVVALDVKPMDNRVGSLGVLLSKDRTISGSTYYRVNVVYRDADTQLFTLARSESFTMFSQAMRRYDLTRRAGSDVYAVVADHKTRAASV